MTIASEITRLQGAKAGIKTAIENKGVTVPSADTIDQYAGYIDQIETGTTIVNGVIKNYLASTSTVDAGTFVEFVNTIGGRTQLTGSTTSISAEAVALEDGKVFVAFRKGPNVHGNRYAVIATISNGAVSFGTEVLLSTNVQQSYADTYVSASPDKSRVLVSWHGANYGVIVIACKISGSSIEVGTEASTSVASSGAGVQGIEWLDDSRAFWGFSYSSSQSQGAVGSVSPDLSITVGTSTVIDTNSWSTFAIKVVSVTKVVSVGYASGPLKARIMTVGSGDTFSVSSDITLKAGMGNAVYGFVGPISLVKISDTDVATLSVGNSSSTASIYTVCSYRVSASGSTPVSVGGSNIFGQNITTDYTSNVSTVRAFDGSDGPYAIINYNSGSLKLAKLRFAISGVAIKEFQAIATGSSVNTYGGAIIGANGLVFYGSSITLNAYPLIAKVKPAGIEVSGFTKTEATTSVPGEVWVLNS